MQSISICTPSEPDRTQWQQLYLNYASFYHKPMTAETLDRVWSWIHHPDEPLQARIAKNAQNEVLGFMHYRQMPSPIRGRQAGFLDDLFVSAAARKQGVATSLLNALNELGKTHNWVFVRWITADDNQTARRLYDKLAKKTNWLTYEMPIR